MSSFSKKFFKVILRRIKNSTEYEVKQSCLKAEKSFKKYEKMIDRLNKK